ncbi:MAG: TIGR02186 family protein, partial [Pseudomonadota bacterium]
MICLRAILIVLLLIAQPTVGLAQATLSERIEIGLSTNVIDITSNFTGEALTIFGAVDNIDPLVQR